VNRDYCLPGYLKAGKSPPRVADFTAIAAAGDCKSIHLIRSQGGIGDLMG